MVYDIRDPCRCEADMMVRRRSAARNANHLPFIEKAFDLKRLLLGTNGSSIVNVRNGRECELLDLAQREVIALWRLRKADVDQSN
jgi:hypothetical protein